MAYRARATRDSAGIAVNLPLFWPYRRIFAQVRLAKCGSCTVCSRAVNHRNAVLRLFSIYCAAAGRSHSRVSTLVWNHGARYRQILSGADLRTRSFERALRWFSRHWPPNVPWPAQIHRPEPEAGGSVALGPVTEPERDLIEAMALGPEGRLRSPAALCRALRIRRTTYDYVMRRYADGRDRADEYPQRGTWSRRLLDHLVASGDVRFAVRRARLERAEKVARQHAPSEEPPLTAKRESDEPSDAS